MRTYIWQPDAEPPETIKARISIKFVENQGCHNVLVLLTTSEDSDKLLPKDPKQIRNRLPGCSSTLSNAEAEILSTIYNLSMMLITDTDAFIEGALKQINHFVGGLFGSFIFITLNLRMDTEVQGKTRSS